MTVRQRNELHAFFLHTNYPSQEQKVKFATKFAKSIKVINTWFNNARQKLKANEGSPMTHVSTVSSIQAPSCYRPLAISGSTGMRSELGQRGNQMSDSEVDAIEALLTMHYRK